MWNKLTADTPACRNIRVLREKSRRSILQLVAGSTIGGNALSDHVVLRLI